MKRMLIGIMGRKYSGKDTIADYISSKYSYQKIAFAEPLKKGCQIMFQFTDKQLEEDKEVIDEYWGVTPRKVFQYIGTDVIRNGMENLIPGIGNDFWINSCMRKYYNLRDSGIKTVISDVRFPNELERIHKEGGIVIKVTRSSLENSDTHASEIQIDEMVEDYLVTNDSDLDSLYEKIDSILLYEIK